MLRPFGFDDPYSWSIGGGIFYERHLLFKYVPLFVGGGLSCYGFYPLEEDFGGSYIVKAGGYLGYDFRVLKDDRFSLNLAPVVGYRHYWREFIYRGEPFNANRAVVFTGLYMNIHIESQFLISLGADIDLLLENNPLFAFCQTERVGWRF
jgi:hypothetical protein